MAGSTPILSVIIPIYNTRNYLDECVSSVLSQSLKNIEIILVDDESPDNAGKKCDDLKTKHENIKVIHKQNGGLGYARNSGLELAEGKYVAFLDSDDYVLPNYYEMMVNECENYNADICTSKGFSQFSEKGREEKVFLHEYGIVDNNIEALIPRLISRKIQKDDGIWGSSCFSVYKRELLQEYHIKFVSEREFMSEDVWFSMDVYNVAKRVVLSDVIGYCYRYNETSLSRSYRQNRFDQLTSTITQLTKKCQQMNLSDYEERVALYYWVNFEKCINQEVRYVEKKTGITNMKRMMINQECRSNLEILLSSKEFKGLHRLLCSLLMKGHYHSVYSILTIYNRLRHRHK